MDAPHTPRNPAVLEQIVLGDLRRSRGSIEAQASGEGAKPPRGETGCNSTARFVFPRKGRDLGDSRALHCRLRQRVRVLVQSYYSRSSAS